MKLLNNQKNAFLKLRATAECAIFLFIGSYYAWMSHTRIWKRQHLSKSYKQQKTTIYECLWILFFFGLLLSANFLLATGANVLSILIYWWFDMNATNEKSRYTERLWMTTYALGLKKIDCIVLRCVCYFFLLKQSVLNIDNFLVIVLLFSFV